MFASQNLLPQNYRIKMMMRGETVKNCDFSDSEDDAIDAIVLYFQSTPNFPSWTSRVRSPSPAFLFSVTYFFLSAFFTCQTVLNDVAVMLSASKYFPSVRLCTPECQRGTLAFVSASFEKWKASQERWRQQTRS
jgi:hypothetical protein